MTVRLRELEIALPQGTASVTLTPSEAFDLASDGG